MIKRILAVELLLVLAIMAASYSSSFSGTENPLSEAGSMGRRRHGRWRMGELPEDAGVGVRFAEREQWRR